MGVLREWWARQSATRKLVVVALAVEPAKRIIGWLFDRAATLGYEKLLESFFAEERAAAMSAAIRDAMLRAEAWLSDPYISGMVSGAFLLALVMLAPPAYRWLMRSSKRPAVKTDHRLPQTGSRAAGSCTYPAFIPQEAQAGDHTSIIVSEVSRFLTNDMGSLIETGRRVVDWPSVLYSEGAEGLLSSLAEIRLKNRMLALQASELCKRRNHALYALGVNLSPIPVLLDEWQEPLRQLVTAIKNSERASDTKSGALAGHAAGHAFAEKLGQTERAVSSIQKKLLEQ